MRTISDMNRQFYIFKSLTVINGTIPHESEPEPLTCLIRLYIHSDLPETAVIKMAMTATQCCICTSTARDAIFN